MNTTTTATDSVIVFARDMWRAWRDRPRTARITEILCPDCGRWRKPRHFTVTAAACRDCT